jgi:hypothetical protein
MADVVLQQGQIASVNHVHAQRTRFHHQHVFIPWSGILPGFMVMLILVMPMSYRAGTETSHPHAVFQTVIDTIGGRSHHADDGHHHASAPSATSSALSPFAPPGVPLNAVQASDQASLASMSMALDPDVPSLTTMKPALDHALTVAAPGVLIVLAATVVTRRSCWPRILTPGANAIAPELPPPQVLSVSVSS